MRARTVLTRGRLLGPSQMSTPVAASPPLTLAPQRDTPSVASPTDPHRASKRVGHAVALVVALGLVGAGVVSGVWFFRRPPQLAVVAARTEDVSRMLAVTGRVEAGRTVLVSPQVAGRITEIVRHEGDRVQKDEVLARLADVSARSDVTEQQAELSSKAGDLAQAQRDLARTSSLVGSGSVSPAELEAARLVVSRATQEVSRLQAILREGRSQLVLLAPFDGTLVRREGELGQVVGPDTAVFELATVLSSRVTAEVDERYVRALRPGMRAEILPAGTLDERRAAAVSYIAQAVDPQTGAATIRLAYEVVPEKVLVGMSVDVNISVETIPGATTIPRESVGGAAAHPFVLVVAGGVVSRRDVDIDDWPAPLVVVRAGLRPGELVAVDPKGGRRGRNRPGQGDARWVLSSRWPSATCFRRGDRALSWFPGSRSESSSSRLWPR